jgi:hypothetical protein
MVMQEKKKYILSRADYVMCANKIHPSAFCSVYSVMLSTFMVALPQLSLLTHVAIISGNTLTDTPRSVF